MSSPTNSSSYSPSRPMSKAAAIKPTSTTTMAASKAAAPKDAKAAGKMHRRSRSGCFTCRLRRKKCEEGKPACKACKHLGLRCDYKRPMWWSNGEQRKAQKELIKNIIKHTQLTKKATPVQAPPAAQHQKVVQPLQPQLNTHVIGSSPPGLTHSVPTSAEVPYIDSFPPQSHCSSQSSPYSTGCEYQYNNSADGCYFGMPPPPPPAFLGGPGQFPGGMFSPYEIDIKTERQVFINDVPTRKDSTISTFSTFQPPPPAHGVTSAFPIDSWVQQEHFESTSEEFCGAEEPVDFNFFQYPHNPLTPDHETVINVEEGDRYLLDYFFEKVLKLNLPVLDVNQHGSARADMVLPALESNKAYLHCCLNIAATHKKALEGALADERIDDDIVRHRYAAVSELCDALAQDTDHAQILEAMLGMIVFQCSVGRPDDSLPDIPWHQHFQAATGLATRLDLPALAVTPPESASPSAPTMNMNMTMTAWVDILGSTVLGRPPTFADTYRELNMNQLSVGLEELMGCSDKVMFLISEITCLDVQREKGLEEVALCKYVEYLASEIGASEAAAHAHALPVQSCLSPTGAIRPRQLAANISAVFRVAARIYLCTLVPGYSPAQPSMRHLIAQFAELMSFIPAGPDGFDRSLAWPLLVAGAAACAGSPFRAMLDERAVRLGEAAHFGSLGRVRRLLADIWQVNDAAEALHGEFQGVRWRDAMVTRGWDHLII